MADFDIAVIGGGINGAGIARDAAGRGLKVLLVEQHDLASGTSSASTKLIHGGLRYLEHGEFRLVRESLREREVMLRIAPHLVQPMRFVLPVEDDLRPRWVIRLGLLLYDWIGGRRTLAASRAVNLAVGELGAPLRRRFVGGFEYSDCVVDDSRLVVLNALDAAERGATIRTRTRCVRVERTDIWTLVLNARGRRTVATARALVNATGPWTARFAEAALRARGPVPVRLVKGSHIVVPSLFDHGHGYILQNKDRRIVFAIPYGDAFTLIGTTDTDFAGDLDALSPTRDEIAYLCDAVNAHFRHTISGTDVVWAFSGVRALYDDRSEEAKDNTRDHELVLDQPHRQAPLLTLYGGKITTYRLVAEAAVDRLAALFVAGPRWTAGTALPGGDIRDGVEGCAARLRRGFPYLSAPHALRLAKAYGSRAERIVQASTRLDDLGPRFGGDLTGAEVRHLMRHEWAETADDVLWRRSKLGLGMAAADSQALAQFMVGATGAA